MDGNFVQPMVAGDLVFMREFDDVRGWITRKDVIFIILGVQKADSLSTRYFRDVVRYAGGGAVGETYAAHFVKIDCPNI